MKTAVMIGPCPDAKGGMASVVAVYRKNGLFSGRLCRYLTTATEGGAGRKLWVAASALMRFAFMLIMRRVSLLHVHGASHGSFWRKRVFMQLAGTFGVPVIFHLHGGEFRQFVDERLDASTRQKVVDSLKACSLIYCLNVAVQVMPNPIDLPHEETPWEKRDSSILFLGRLEQEKGVFDLLAAFSAIARQAPEARLLLCGVGSARAKLEKIVQENGLTSRVDFPGWVDGEEKACLLRRAGVFVLPSYAEGMPMSVLEAMVAGTPVVASRVGAVPEMLENGNSGFVVEAGRVDELAEAILAALDDSRTADLSSRALARVREFYSAKVVLDRLRWQYAKLAP